MAEFEPSNRKFGSVLAVVFAVIGFSPLLWAEQPLVWALAAAAAFVTFAIVAPSMLQPLNQIAMRYLELFMTLVRRRRDRSN